MKNIRVSLDFETADNGADSACALGMVKFSGTEIIESFYSLIRPPRRRMLFTHIHGIRWSDVQDSPTFRELWPLCAAFMCDAQHLLAHNAPFDRRVLYACCEAAAVPRPVAPFLCTLKGARKSLDLSSNTLDCVCAHFDIPLQHHQADSDALAAARVYMCLRDAGLSDTDMLLNTMKTVKKSS